MAVLIEAVSVIIRREAIQSRYSGKWQSFLRESPNNTRCSDGEIVRIGFFTESAARIFVSQLEQRGLIFRCEGQAKDIALMDQLHGPSCPVPWLEYGQVLIGQDKISACWAKGSASKQIIVPDNWRFEGSLSEKQSFAHANGDEINFSALILGALRTNAPVENKIPNFPIHERLENDFLPKALLIAENEGRDIAFSHFVVGIILRLLSRPVEAESRFRQANELQPGVLNTLQELVRCLGEQNRDQEALVFAREAVTIAPRDAGAWSNLAMAFMQCGHQREARQAIDKAILFDPKDPSIRYINDNFDNYFCAEGSNANSAKIEFI